MPELQRSDINVNLNIGELSKLLDLCEQLILAMRSAATLSRQERQQMNEAIGETCELIDSILTMVKQRISTIIKAIRLGDGEARTMLIELDNAWEWEEAYRQFHLCEPLRNAASELRETVLGRIANYVTFRDPGELRTTINAFLDGETVAGEFVSRLLADLSRLYERVDTEPDFVLERLEEARTSLQMYRDRFINLEKQLRMTV